MVYIHVINVFETFSTTLRGTTSISNVRRLDQKEARRGPSPQVRSGINKFLPVPWSGGHVLEAAVPRWAPGRQLKQLLLSDIELIFRPKPPLMYK